MLKLEYLLVFEVRWRDHGSQTIAGIVDGVEDQVVWVVINCSQEDFVDIVKQVRRSLYFDMPMEFRDHKIIFLCPSRTLLEV